MPGSWRRLKSSNRRSKWKERALALAEKLIIRKKSNQQSLSGPLPVVPGQVQAFNYLVHLLRCCAQPAAVLEAYLACPLRNFSFCAGLQQLARKHDACWLAAISLFDQDTIGQAKRMLQWLDGERPNGRDPFKVLELSYSVTEKQLTDQYRKLSKRLHPDRHRPSKQEYWRERQREVNQAYAILSDQEQRTEWLAEFNQREKLLQRLQKIEASLK